MNLHGLVFRLGSGQILIGIRFKINQAKTRKQGVDTVDNTSHFPIFTLQRLLVPASPDKQSNYVNDKQCNYHNLQPDAYHIFIYDHALRNGFGKSLYQHIIVVLQAYYTDIVCLAAGTADKSSFSAFFKYASGSGRRILIDHAGFRQFLQQIFLVRNAVGTGNGLALRRTQKHIGRFAEISGGKHIFQVFFRQICAPQHAYNFVLIINRRVKAGHGFIVKTRIKNNGNVTFPPNSLRIKVTACHIGSPSVRSMIHTADIREH